MRTELRAVLAGAYRGAMRRTLTHVVEVDDKGNAIRVFCPVALENLADVHAIAPDKRGEPPTCATCLRRTTKAPHTDAPIRLVSARDHWMLDFWADSSRHDVWTEERAGMPDREFRNVCKCGYIGPVTRIITPPGVCPILVTLRARATLIQSYKDLRQRERNERPQRLWVRLKP